MRILALNYEFPPLGGGAGNATAHICRELVRLGCDVAVLTSAYKDLPRNERVDGYAVHRVPVLRRRVDQCSPLEMATFVISAMAPAVKLARQFKPDILHVYFGVPTGPIGLLVKRMTGVPYLLSLRGGDVPGFLVESLGNLHRLIGPLNHRVWDNASVVVANSEGLRELAQKSLSRGAVRMVPNGVDLETYAPSALLRSDGVFRILFVGRLVEQKGARYILEVLPQVMAQIGADVEVAVVGSGPEEPALRQQARRLNLVDKVRFRGWVARKDMPEQYRRTDVFVFPSFEEGMPNVVLEAMASGLPVVATDIYGNRELVVDGDNGVLVPSGNAAALCKALVRLAQDPDLRQRLGGRSRDRGYRGRGCSSRGGISGDSQYPFEVHWNQQPAQCGEGDNGWSFGFVAVVRGRSGQGKNKRPEGWYVVFPGRQNGIDSWRIKK